MKIFEYAAILHPSDDEKKAGKRSVLIVDVTRILAKDQSEATILAARAIPDEHLDELDRVEVAVRPF